MFAKLACGLNMRFRGEMFILLESCMGGKMEMLIILANGMVLLMNFIILKLKMRNILMGRRKFS